jgi:hypothetical protein
MTTYSTCCSLLKFLLLYYSFLPLLPQVLEQGTHAELMALPDGGYARLVAAQGGAGGGGKSESVSRSVTKQRSGLSTSASRTKLAGMDAGSQQVQQQQQP